MFTPIVAMLLVCYPVSEIRAQTSNRPTFSWQTAYTKVLPNGDLHWAPRPFQFVEGRSLRYIDFVAGDDANDGTTTDARLGFAEWTGGSAGGVIMRNMRYNLEDKPHYLKKSRHENSESELSTIAGAAPKNPQIHTSSFLIGMAIRREIAEADSIHRYFQPGPKPAVSVPRPLCHEAGFARSPNAQRALAWTRFRKFPTRW